MISLKLPKKSKKELKNEMAITAPDVADQPQYPYGAKLSFSGETLDKLKSVKNLNAKDKVSISAKGYVCLVQSIDSSGDDYYEEDRVEIQITDIEVAKGRDSMSMKEYAKSRGKKY